MQEAALPVAIERATVVTNREGLHFRPIMRLVDLLNRFSAKVNIRCEDRAADARSPMELLMLVAAQGATLTVSADGADAQDAVDAVCALIESGFDES